MVKNSNLLFLISQLGRLKESVAECTEALKLDENYLKALLRRAASYMDLKEYEEAVRDLEQACKMDKSRGKNSIFFLLFVTFLIYSILFLLINSAT